MAKSKNPSKGGNYSVGKGKPPVHSRWPKGVSGNPGGKTKSSIDLRQAFKAALSRPIPITIEGEKYEVPAVDAIVMRLVEFGLKGDMRAINSILDRSTLLLREDGDDQKVETSEDDLAILQRVLPEREPKPSRKRQRKTADSVEDEGAQPFSSKREADND